MQLRSWLAVAVLCSLGPLATPRADTLQATRRMPMFEAAHTVDIKLADGVATYVVRRMFSNPGAIADQVELRFDLPSGAAVTGLRIRASDRWYDGVLMERDKAADLYREMTGFGSATAKDPALLAWLWADKMSLQVFPVMPGTVSTVEYTLTVPTRYEHGRYFVSYPRSTSASDGTSLPLATPVVSVHPAWGGARTSIIVDGKRVARDTPVVLLPPAREPWHDIVEAAAGASYAASTLVIPTTAPAQRTFARVTLAVALAHTYKGDLAVDLVTPAGARVAVHRAGQGGGDNDIAGTFDLELPPGTQAAGTWRLVVSDHAALDTGSLDRWSLTFGTGKEAVTQTATDTPVFVPDAPESASDAGVAAISVAPPAFATWQARLGRATASAAHVFSRLEVDVAPQLSALPVRAQVAFVVDASHSLGPDGIAAQLAVLRAYVAHVPDAEVEIVAYRRHAARVFGRFVPVRDLGDALAVAQARGAFAPGNGSALDEGARLAAQLLAERRGPRRMVVLHDTLARSALTPVLAQAALAKLPADAVVHVVVPLLEGSPDRPTLARKEGTWLTPLATRHHGIHVELDGLAGVEQKVLAPVALELVRPTRLDGVSATGFVLESETLAEGDGVRLLFDDPKVPARVRLAGTLWSDPVIKDIAVTPAFSVQTAAFVFGADRHQGLSEAEQYTLAMFGRAVSPVTSYVAWEPGVRPSTIGLEEGMIGTGSYASVGFGSGGGAYGGRIKPNFLHLVDTEACVAAVHPAGAWRTTLTVETTRDEVVDVTAAGTDAMSTCLAEAVWALRLDPAGFTLDRESFTFELSGS